jgi:hypothetical protein
MKTANLISETLRHSESGLCWEEKITNGTGSLELRKAATFRVRATGATTVTIDGVLAATMSSGEVIIFNAGDGDPDDTKPTVTVTIAAVAAFVQVAREIARPKLAV